MFMNGQTTSAASLGNYYRRLLGATDAPRESTIGNESLEFTAVPEMQDRTERAREELHRIVAKYLGNDPRLLELADRVAKEGGEALRMIDAGDDAELERRPDAAAALEAIVRTDGSRPSFLVVDGDVDRDSSPVGSWGPLLDAGGQRLRNAIAAVGRIDVPGSSVGFQGTAFLVQHNLVVTNRHVLQVSARQDSEGKWTFVEGAAIDFGHELGGRDTLNRRRLKSVVFYGPDLIDNFVIDHRKLDLVLIELEDPAPGETPPHPFALNLSSQWTAPGTRVLTIGYPGNPPANLYPPTLLEQLFQKTYGFKRLAPGEVMSSAQTLPGSSFAHDATTLGGTSGSGVLVAGSEGLVAGLHYGGRGVEPRENWAHVLGEVIGRTGGGASATLGEVLDRFHVQFSGGLAASTSRTTPPPAPETPSAARSEAIRGESRRSPAQEKLTKDLQHLLSTSKDHDRFDVNIFLRGEPVSQVPKALTESVAAAESVSDAARVVRNVVDTIKKETARLQAPLLATLGQAAATLEAADTAVPSEKPESYWITNAIGARVSPSMLREILKRDDVQLVDLSRHVDLAELLDARRAPARKANGKKPGKARPAVLADKAAAPPAPRRIRKPAPRPRRKKPGQGALEIPAADAGPEIAWSVRKINAPLCWQEGITGQGILVALIDTGVNYNHPDLKNRMWNGGNAFPKHGYDFENDDNDPMDAEGHGTATAGQVAGDGASGTKTGVAPEATILAIRVGGVERNFWKGMQFAIDRQAKVVSMSMSWKYPSGPDYPGWRRVCESLLAANVLHANSIGNQGNDLVRYPVPFNIATPGNCPPPWLHASQVLRGSLSSSISVGATDSGDNLADYSGRGPGAWSQGQFSDYPYVAGDLTKAGLIKPDVCAPGPGTTSCNVEYNPAQPGSKPYIPFSGTSAATPHVGGCLALLAHACVKAGKPIVPAQIQEALERTAHRVQGQTSDKENHYGSGRVDVYAAYQFGKSKNWW
jgi:subtilisin family serine protease